MLHGKQILVATGNAKKAREILALLAPCDVEVLSLSDVNVDMPEETGETFAENAALKALSGWRQTGLCTLADDSGLQVDALGGEPGVYSARYAGADATDEANNARLLKALADVPDEKRGAQFVCHLALADPQGEVRLAVHGVCRGRILRERRGQDGFGYDPLFWVPEYHRTFAELGLVAKSVLSHRARAFAQLRAYLL